MTRVTFDPSFAEVRPTFTSYWFYEMRRLESITGMNYLNTSEVARMDAMFNRCYKLTSLDLSSFNTANVTDMSEMFRSCSALRTIYVGDGWQLSDMALSFSRNLFNDCTNLVGGMGTIYDANHVNADYAHIDGGPDNPGYFSEKPVSPRGDVNGDGSVDISDVTALISLVLNGNSTAASNPEADLTGDGEVNIGDVTTLISIVLNRPGN